MDMDMDMDMDMETDMDMDMDMDMDIDMDMDTDMDMDMYTPPQSKREVRRGVCTHGFHTLHTQEEKILFHPMLCVGE